MTPPSIEKYGILANPDPVLLAEQVNKAITEGWQPVGPVTVVPQPTGFRQSLLQTIVKTGAPQ